MSATHWNNVKTRWTTRINTAYTAGDLEEEDYNEALGLLDRWIDAEEAQDVAAATDIASYSTGTGRSVTRRSQAEMATIAANARGAFMQKLHGNVTYTDFRREGIPPDTEAARVW